MVLLRCPICDRSFPPEESQALPFCSQRCRQIDLGRWLDERYGILYESPGAVEEPLPGSEQPRVAEDV
ncbi:MAG: DNA gyrase inhibitor YacG [Pirellulales bacterium]|nr:DNA gyrase inhibitor YacG [Pirellulales bacterium]